MEELVRELEYAARGVSMVRAGYIVGLVGGIALAIAAIIWASSLVQNPYQSVSARGAAGGLTIIAAASVAVAVASSLLQILGFRRLCIVLSYGCITWKVLAGTLVFGVAADASLIASLHSSSIKSLASAASAASFFSLSSAAVGFVASLFVGGTLYSMGDTRSIPSLKIGGASTILLGFLILLNAFFQSIATEAIEAIVFLVAFVTTVRGLGAFRQSLLEYAARKRLEGSG